jgi:hypothetical protein
VGKRLERQEPNIPEERDLPGKQSRREEWMVSRCLFTGKIICLDGDTNEIVAEVDIRRSLLPS